MDEEDEAVIEGVKKILNSGNGMYINALKLNVNAYLACINTDERQNQQLAELERKLSYLEVEAQKQGYDCQGLKVVRKGVEA